MRSQAYNLVSSGRSRQTSLFEVCRHRGQDICPAVGGIPGAGDAEAVPIPDGAYDEANTWSQQLRRYLEGWAEVNLSKIFAATAPGYRFDDPFVGLFTRWSLQAYFERLQARFACAGVAAAQDLAFFIRGPMEGPLSRGRLKFFREAPRLGLTGITFITIGERGVIAESVAYDLNMALAVHRRRAPFEQL
jgi:hypothetical protein